MSRPSSLQAPHPMPLALLTGTAHPAFAHAVSTALETPLSAARVGRFADGEVRVEIDDNVRGTDLFIVQPTCPPVNDNLMEMLLLIDAARRSSARRITAVMPYYGYARQDRKASPRAPISARLVADMLQSAGVDRVMTVDIHAAQVQGFFHCPMENLHAAPLIAQDIQRRFLQGSYVLVAPDVGGVTRVRSLARRLDAPLAILDKRREAPNQSHIMNLIGDVRGKTALLIDDMIDTAGTLCHAAEALLNQGGAQEVHAYASHGVFSAPALERLEKSPLASLCVTNSLPAPASALKGRLHLLDIAPHVANAISCLHHERSIQALYETDAALKTV